MGSHEPGWEKELRGKPFLVPMTAPDMWERWEKRIAEPKRPRRGRGFVVAVAAGILAAALVCSLAAARLDPDLIGSARERIGAWFASKPPVTDTVTPVELPPVASLGALQLIHTIANDAMAWSLHFGLGSPVVVDRDYYVTRAYSTDRPVARGDIVYYKTKASADDIAGGIREPYDIARVVGLPGETVRIRKGRISIDGRPLQAFYGEENRGRDDVKKFSDTDQEVKLGPGDYYLLGDAWSRSFNDSQLHGAFAREAILGKVIGYYNPPDERHTDWVEAYRENGLTIKAARSDTGTYQRYLVDWGGQRKEFYWTGSADPSYPPTVTMADMDGDGEKEAVIAFIIGTGTELAESEVHVLRRGLTEIPVADPVEAARSAADKAEVNRDGDKVEATLEIGGTTIAKQYDDADAGLWFDRLGIGAVVYYRVEGGRLVSDMSVFASPATYVAQITAEYRMKDGMLVPSVFTASEGD